MAPKSKWVRVGGENLDTFSFDAVTRLRIQALTRMNRRWKVNRAVLSETALKRKQIS
jgi:hypothetical protein